MQFRPMRMAVLMVSFVGVLPATGAAGTCWPPPVPAGVIDAFREPDCRWCAGNRGIEYGTSPGSAVRSVASGRVTFSGVVVGRHYVVVDVGEGRRVTYGGLVDRFVREGQVVSEGTVLGRSGPTLHLGVRVGEVYLDPAAFVGQLVGRPRLIPSDGRPGPPSRPVVRCGGAARASAR